MCIIRVGIADPQRIFREGVQALLEQQEEFQVVGQASDGVEATALAKEHAPDVLLMELTMPRSSGLGTLRDLRNRGAPTRCLLLVGAPHREELYEALELGAYGWISKNTETQMLFRSIRAVASGEYWVARDSIGQLVEALRRNTRAGNGFHATGRYGLTLRELEILTKILGGSSNRDIARELTVSERTVKHHLTHMFDKVGASTRLELAIFAVHHNLAE